MYGFSSLPYYEDTVRAMPMQVIPIFLGFDHCHPFQDKYSHDLSITGLGLPWLTSPGGQYLSYLDLAIPYIDIPPAWVRHRGKSHHLPWNASPRGFQIVTLMIPLILRTSGSLSSFFELTLFEVISLRLYLTNPGSNWGKVPKVSSLVHGILKSSPRVLLQRYFPLRGMNITSVLIVFPVWFYFPTLFPYSFS